MQNNTTILPLVSVVMCTFNGEKYLRPQLDSILAQSWKNIELIISDDASTDNTVQLLEEYRKKDDRIKILLNTANLGYNRNFEKAFAAAAAAIIAISDQDDIWEQNKIEMMMKNWPGDALFCFSLSGTFYNDDFSGRRPAPDVQYGPVTRSYQLVFSSPVHGHASMFKKELLQDCSPFPSDIYYDWWLSMYAVRKAPLGCLPETLTWHRRHDDNSSRNILSIKDREEKNRQLREQFVHALETYLSRTGIRQEEDRFLQHYCSLLKKMDGHRFSFPMFFYILKHRKKIFHYKKKKPFLFFSHLKHALRMARTGVL